MASAMKNHLKSLFDFGPLAAVYEDWYSTPEGKAHDLVQQKDVAALLPPAREGQKLLDVGCGTGHWCRFFSAQGYRVKGIDISTEMISVARQALPELSFEVGDAGTLPFDDGSFDVTTSITALEFFPDPDAAVKEMARCSRSDGLMLIGTLNRIAPINQERLAAAVEPFVSGHLLGPKELLDLISPFGEVRMVSSPVPGPRKEPRLILANPDPTDMNDLLGPLLVALVRRREQ